MRTLGLIPARGGSKGIPRKNVRTIAGKPLISWTIESALASRVLAAVVVSTDDEEIAEVARAAGAEVPFMRPAELAADETSGVAPVLHAMTALPQFDSVLLMQPTSPMRGPADVEGILDVARNGAESIVSVSEARCHPQWMFEMGDGAELRPIVTQADAVRRQDLPPLYALNGAMYFATRPWLETRRAFIGEGTIGYLMPPERSVDIDDMLDWRLAELLLRDREAAGSDVSG